MIHLPLYPPVALLEGGNPAEAFTWPRRLPSGFEIPATVERRFAKYYTRQTCGLADNAACCGCAKVSPNLWNRL